MAGSRMMVVEPYQIILLIVVFVAFAYVSLLLYVLSNIREFNRRLKKKIRGLCVIVSEQAELLLSISSVYSEMGVYLGEDAAVLEELEDCDFESQQIDEVFTNVKKIKTASSRLTYLAQSSEALKKDQRYISFTETMADLDRNHRQCVALYNADIAGFNYWINVPTTRWFVWLLGFRKRASFN